MSGTWALYGVDGDGEGKADPFDPLDAIAAQAGDDCAPALALQLASASAAGQVRGDLTQLMLAAYNAGTQAVLAAHGVPPFDETTSYVQTVTTRAPPTPPLRSCPHRADTAGSVDASSPPQ
jgi:hypothetical protein